MSKPLSHNGLVFLRLKDSDCRTTYGGLLYVAKEKGYSRGWVAHTFRKIFNGWPKPRSAVEPQEPDALLREGLSILSRRFRAKRKREELRLAGMGDRGSNGNSGNIGGVVAPESALMSSEDWDWVA